MRLLVIEDDRKISSFLEKGFKEAGYAVDVASDGVEGLHLAESGIYDAAVVDIMLPGLDGLSLTQQLRSKQDNTPVVILSAKRSVDDRIKGLQRGGDDYMVKPFSFSELLARIQALVRRSSQTVAPSSLEFEELGVDLRPGRSLAKDRRLNFSRANLHCLNTGRGLKMAGFLR